MGVHGEAHSLSKCIFCVNIAGFVQPQLLLLRVGSVAATWASVRDDRVVYRPFPIVDSRCFGLWAGVPPPLLLLFLSLHVPGDITDWVDRLTGGMLQDMVYATVCLCHSLR